MYSLSQQLGAQAGWLYSYAPSVVTASVFQRVIVSSLNAKLGKTTETTIGLLFLALTFYRLAFCV